jgi:hypothetical protein
VAGNPKLALAKQKASAYALPAGSRRRTGGKFSSYFREAAGIQILVLASKPTNWS